MSIHILPPEILDTIFEYFPFSQRLLLSGICLSWHKLIFKPQFCKRLVLHLNSAKDLVEKPYAKEMFVHPRNVVINCANFTSHELRSLRDCMKGATVDFLKICTANSIAKRVVDMLLGVVPELKSLYLILKGDSENCSEVVIQIRHQKLQCVVLNGNGKYDIDCTTLNALQSDRMLEKAIQKISSLQGQLTHLKFARTCQGSPYRAAFNISSNYRWDRLLEFSLINLPPIDNLEKIIEQMPCLQKLTLHGSPSHETFTGNEIGTETPLSELILEKYCIDPVSLNKLLTHSSMTKISLRQCTFSSLLDPLKSSSIKNLYFQPTTTPILMPRFPSLEILDLQGVNDRTFYRTFLKICDYYPKLERLTLGMTYGKKLKPHSNNGIVKKSFAALKKLNKLKVLHLERVDLTGINWNRCVGSKVEHIHLKFCNIHEAGAKSLIGSFKHLRTFYLDYCTLQVPKAKSFGEDGLREVKPHCQISFHDVSIQNKKKEALTSELL